MSDPGGNRTLLRNVWDRPKSTHIGSSQGRFLMTALGQEPVLNVGAQPTMETAEGRCRGSAGAIWLAQKPVRFTERSGKTQKTSMLSCRRALDTFFDSGNVKSIHGEGDARNTACAD